MPFTFSHPAIVLPLTFFSKKWFSLTGLIIGSLIPDFEYFLRMSLQSKYSHTFEGILWFDLPLALLLGFVFHNIVRNSLIDNLPMFLKIRFSAFRHFDWNRYFKRNWVVVILSVLIGTGSHLLWDSFTHEGGYFVRIMPTLTNTVDVLGIPIPILKILQHLSTITGGLAIALIIYKLPASPVDKGSIDLKYWSIVAGLTLTIVVARLSGGLDIRNYGNVIVSIISAIMIALILTPLLIRRGIRKY